MASTYPITCTYVTGDGPITMRKVCHHNWRGSPDGDACVPDSNGYCVYLAPDEQVACHHAGFRGSCTNECAQIDGSNCLILSMELLLSQTFPDVARQSNAIISAH